MNEEQKTAILLTMEEARAKGITRVRTCAMWMIDRRRVLRWAGNRKRGQSLDNGKPGPNQRWCWDTSYLHTYERSVFLYLYLLLDEYSRKAINWLISWRQGGRGRKAPPRRWVARREHPGLSRSAATGDYQ
jgi:hypothetical protein